MTRSTPAGRVPGIGLSAAYAMYTAAEYRNNRIDPEGRRRSWREFHALAEAVAATASTHLADLRDKARVILALQEAQGILDAPSGYHALVRSLARDVLARPSS